MRQLRISDNQGHVVPFEFQSGPDFQPDTSPFTAFPIALDQFIAEHLDEGDNIFRVDHLESGEWLLIDVEAGILSFGDNSGDTEPKFMPYDTTDKRSDVAIRFAGTGNSALEEMDEWTSNRDSLRGHQAAEAERRRREEMSASDEHEGNIQSLPPLDQTELDAFCQVWSDTGYVEYINDDEAYYVLFDTYEYDDVEESERERALAAISALGLTVVDSRSGQYSGEIWVRTDPRVDKELGLWS